MRRERPGRGHEGSARGVKERGLGLSWPGRSLSASLSVRPGENHSSLNGGCWEGDIKQMFHS